MPRSKEYAAALDAAAALYHENNAANPGTAFNGAPKCFANYRDRHARGVARKWWTRSGATS